MTMCETVVPILIAQLKALYARECRTHQDLRLHITEALAHFGSQIQALQLQDPLEMQFLEVYGHLAIWRIEQFRNDILQRVTMLNASPLVQRAIQMLPSCTAITWQTADPEPASVPSIKQAKLQHITTGFLALLHGLEQIQQQMLGLIQGLRNLQDAAA